MMKSWSNALALCMRQDMDLVTFDARDELDQFTTLFEEEKYWVGITDVVNEAIFRNYNGFEKFSGAFLNWFTDSPTILTAKSCVMMEKTGSSDYKCTEFAKFACERRIPVKAAIKVDSSFVSEPAGYKFHFVSKSGRYIKLFRVLNVKT